MEEDVCRVEWSSTRYSTTDVHTVCMLKLCRNYVCRNYYFCWKRSRMFRRNLSYTSEVFFYEWKSFISSFILPWNWFVTVIKGRSKIFNLCNIFHFEWHTKHPNHCSALHTVYYLHWKINWNGQIILTDCDTWRFCKRIKRITVKISNILMHNTNSVGQLEKTTGNKVTHSLSICQYETSYTWLRVWTAIVQ